MSWFRRVGVGVVTSMSLACGGMQGSELPSEQQPPAPRVERSRKPMPEQGGDPRSVLPLYTLGDVNEDGVVDSTDLDLVTKLVGNQAAAEATCPAAADLDLDGVVTAKDCTRLAMRVKD